jgi:small subunit ribosomal protein S20
MAHSKQAAKRHRQNIKARTRNKAQRTAVKSALKGVRRAASLDEAKQMVPDAMKRIDKAAKRRVIHPNAAARLKSRMAKRLAAGGR